MLQHAVRSSRQERPTKYVHYVVVESNYAQQCTSARATACSAEPSLGLKIRRGGTNINRFSVFFSEPQNYGGVKVSPSPPSNDGSSLALDGIEVGEHFLLSCVPGYIDRSAQAHFFMAQNHKGSVFLWWLIIPFEFERQNVFDYLII